jgi:hypothetical protein
MQLPRFLLLFILLNLTVGFLPAEQFVVPRLLQIDKVLRTYGFQNGRLDTNYSYIKDVNDAVVAVYGLPESHPVLSSPEEFISAAYFFPNILPWNHNNSAINKELPHNKEGGQRLLSMWLKKKAEVLVPMFYSGQSEDEITNLTRAYTDVVILLKRLLKYSDSEVNEYYSGAISNYLYLLYSDFLKETLPEEKQSTDNIQPLIEYYINPTKNNFDEAVRSLAFIDKFIQNETNRQADENYDRFLNGLDSSISTALKERILLENQPLQLTDTNSSQK